MEKLIIENRTDRPISELLGYIASVLDMGKISETSKGKQYCFATTFKDGIVIFADKNKKSDKLIITKDEEIIGK